MKIAHIFRPFSLLISTAGINIISSLYIQNHALNAASYVIFQNLISLALNANTLYFSKEQSNELSIPTLIALYTIIGVSIVFCQTGKFDILILTLSITTIYFNREKIWEIELQDTTKFCWLDGKGLIFSSTIFLITLYFSPEFAISAGILSRTIFIIIKTAKPKPTHNKCKFNYKKIEHYILAQIFIVGTNMSSIAWAKTQTTETSSEFIRFITLLSIGPLAFNYISRFINRIDYLKLKKNNNTESLSIILALLYTLSISTYFSYTTQLITIKTLTFITIFQTGTACIERRLWNNHGLGMLTITSTNLLFSIPLTNLGYGYLSPATHSILIVFLFLFIKLKK